MPSSDLPTFLSVLVIVIAALVWWRAAIILVGALLIALLVTGVQQVAGGIDLNPARDTPVGSVPAGAVPGTPTLTEPAPR